MSNKRFQHNPMSVSFAYGSPKSHSARGERPYTCPDGHSHFSDAEAQRCLDANKVYICCKAHAHTTLDCVERCDRMTQQELEREEREDVRKHQRAMAENQVKLARELRALGFNFQKHGYPANMPQLCWKEYQE